MAIENTEINEEEDQSPVLDDIVGPINQRLADEAAAQPAPAPDASPTPMPSPAIQPASATRPVAGPGYIYMGPNAGLAASRPIANPSVSAQPWLNQQRAVQDEMGFNRMMKDARSDPDIQSAQAAESAALKFQAQRGYQRDIDNGMGAAEAMTKWGPMLFGSTPSGMKNAMSAIRASQPPSTKYFHVGNELWQVPPGGNPSVVNNPNAAPVRNPMAIQEHKFVLGQIAEERKALASDPNDKAAQARLSALEARRDELNPRQAPTPSASTQPKSGRVRVRDSNGKIGTIPASQLEDAIKEGYTQVK